MLTRSRCQLSKRPSFSAEFKREVADFVLKQNYSYIEASRSLGVGESRVAVYESFISPAALALSHAPEHESPGKLLGQFADGACVSEFENRMDTDHELPNGPRGPA